MLSGVYNSTRQDQVIYGRPAGEVVPELMARIGKGRALVVSTRSLSGAGGLAPRIAEALGGLCAGVFGGVSAHSPREAVIGIADEARRLDCDLLIAVGGGSVVDAAKVAQLCVWQGLTRPDELDPYRAGIQAGPTTAPMTPRGDPLRTIAVPTTLSAAEFTPFAGVTDVARHAKSGYGHPLMVPRAVVLDPAAGLSTPLPLWFSTGLKAVDHSVEQLCARERSPFADALAAEGLRLLSQGLVATRRDPADLDARQACQFGMWLAITGAAAGRGGGASHAIGHTLGGMCAVPHGLTSCVILPAVLRWNAQVNGERQTVVAALMGAQGGSAAEAVEALCGALGLPTRLPQVGIAETQLEAIAEHTLGDRGVRTNPRPIGSAADLLEILRMAMEPA
jgi:maleylacetate reductase